MILENLSKIWHIDIETAKRTTNLTSQHVKHEGSDYLRRQQSTNDQMFCYKRIRILFFLATFAVTVKAVSKRDNQYIQLFVSDTVFMYTYPMKEKAEIVNVVNAFAIEIGVQTALILDPTGEQRSKELTKETKEVRCPLNFQREERNGRTWKSCI